MAYYDLPFDKLFQIRIAFVAISQQHHLNLRAPILQMARRHQPIAAVVAGPDEHGNAAPRRGAQVHPDLLRDAEAGVLHQRLGRAALRGGLLLQRAHLSGGDEFHSRPRSVRRFTSRLRLNAGSSPSARDATTDALAYWRSWLRLMSMPSKPISSARALAPP